MTALKPRAVLAVPIPDKVDNPRGVGHLVSTAEAGSSDGRVDRDMVNQVEEEGLQIG